LPTLLNDGNRREMLSQANIVWMEQVILLGDVPF
jgi:hypothetical protein